MKIHKELDLNVYLDLMKIKSPVMVLVHREDENPFKKEENRARIIYPSGRIEYALNELFTQSCYIDDIENVLLYKLGVDMYETIESVIDFYKSINRQVDKSLYKNLVERNPEFLAIAIMEMYKFDLEDSLFISSVIKL